MFQYKSYTAFDCGLCATMYVLSELVLNKWWSNCIFVCALYQQMNVCNVNCVSIYAIKGIDYITFILPIADQIGNIWWSSRTRLKINIYFYLLRTHWNGFNGNIISRIRIHLSFSLKSPTFQLHAYIGTLNILYDYIVH